MNNSSTQSRQQRGFTLVELLVAIVIMLIVTTMTITTVNMSLDRDRIRSSARQVQSYIEGARNRAVFAGEPRGVRFFVDEYNPATASSMVYIGPLEPEFLGWVNIDDDGITVAQVGGSSWSTLAGLGAFVQGGRIRIVSSLNADIDEGVWYAIDTAATFNTTTGALLATNRLVLASQFERPSDASETLTLEYELELAPAVLPSQEPALLAAGITIDVAHSQLPSTRVPNRYFDVLFSPRGTVTGRAAADGLVHLIMSDIVDVSNNLSPGDPSKQGDEKIVTLFTRTGHVSTHPVYTPDNWLIVGDRDPLRYAETGEVAK
jgi:prepilin-type N-terminal cleavage/methylation domain-containing protein